MSALCVPDNQVTLCVSVHFPELHLLGVALAENILNLKGSIHMGAVVFSL